MNNNYAIHNDRTAGTMPTWNKASTNSTEQQNNNQSEHFGFADLIDMINPLQHIPLVNMAYQKITGDEIKPMSQVIGGAVFGGALGAGGALVNVAIEAETGKNIGEHAIAMVDNASEQQYQNKSNISDHPENNLNNALALLQTGNTGSAIAYTDLRHTEYNRIETKPVADGRTAGFTHTERFDINSRDNVYHREPITELHISDMPSRRKF